MAKANFEQCLRFVLQYEGGFVDHPRDPGGATNMGITHATLAGWRKRPVTVADVRALTRDEAAAIYRQMYWSAIGADRLPDGVDLIAFDIAVNMGVGRARVWLMETAQLSPRARLDALGRRRLSFWRRLRTWTTFGRGWTARGRACVLAAHQLAFSAVA